jgi:hypothetical protein
VPNRDKASLDISWLKGESLEESDNLPDPDVLAQEIVEDLEAAVWCKANRSGISSIVPSNEKESAGEFSSV